MTDKYLKQSQLFQYSTWLCKKKPIPWSWALPERQKFPQLISKFPSLFDTRNCVTVFTALHKLSLSLAKCFQSKTFNLISPSSTPILFSYLPLPIGFSLSGFATKIFYFLYLNACSFTRVSTAHTNWVYRDSIIE